MFISRSLESSAGDRINAMIGYTQLLAMGIGGP
jgi:hypothetical protein